MKPLKNLHFVARELMNSDWVLGLVAPRNQWLRMTQSQVEKCFLEHNLAWGEFVRLFFGADLQKTWCLLNHSTFDTAAAFGTEELAEQSHSG